MDTEKKNNTEKQQKGSARRQFLTETVPAATGALVLAAGLGLYHRSAKALPAYAIRPPGALPEGPFQEVAEDLKGKPAGGKNPKGPGLPWVNLSGP